VSGVRRAKVILNARTLDSLIQLPEGMTAVRVWGHNDPMGIAVEVVGGQLDEVPDAQESPILGGAWSALFHVDDSGRQWVRWGWAFYQDEPPAYSSPVERMAYWTRRIESADDSTAGGSRSIDHAHEELTRAAREYLGIRDQDAAMADEPPSSPAAPAELGYGGDG